jgi:hypothetical protein
VSNIIPFDENIREQWWRAKKPDVANAIFETVTFLDDNQLASSMRNLRVLRLYADSDTEGLTPAEYANRDIIRIDRTNRITMNVVKSVVDTAVAKIGKQKPRPFALTFKGNFSQQRRAKRLNQFMMGQFGASDVYKNAQEAVKDAAIFGTGFIKNYEKNGKIVAERVFPNEILVDDEESIYGEPRQLFQHKVVTKEVLRSMFPEGKFRQAIDEASLVRGDQDVSKGIGDMASIVEAWHLPSGPDANDGRHVIAISDKALLDEPWDSERFPFSIFRWNKRPLGYWGEGLVDPLKGIQFEINLILRKIQALMRLATSHVFIHKGSKIVKSHLTNDDWGVIEYVGQAPIFTTIQSVSPEYFSHLDRLWTRAFELAGISELAATSKKPAGLNSGRAIIEFQDAETERFALIGQELERFYLDIADQQIDIAKEIHDRDGEYAVVSQAGREVELIEWDEVQLERDKFLMQVYPVGFLPQTPAGKWEVVAQMMEAGFLGKDEAGTLLDYPDLDAITSLQNSPIHYAELVVELILDKGQFVAPDPHSNLLLNVKIATFALLRGQLNNVPENRLEMLRQYINDANNLLSSGAPDQGVLPPGELPPEEGAPISPQAGLEEAQLAEPGQQPQPEGIQPV